MTAKTRKTTDETPDPAPPRADAFGRDLPDVPEGFVAMENTTTGGLTFLPDNEGVLAHHEALGWTRIRDTAPADEPAAAEPSDVSGSDK